MPLRRPAFAHQAMFGAWLVRRLPWFQRPAWGLEQGPQGLFLLWAAYVGLLIAGAVLLYEKGVWAMLLRADPTGLTLAILLLFAVCTGWVGARAWHLGRQREALLAWSAPLPAAGDTAVDAAALRPADGAAGRVGQTGAPIDRRWAHTYLEAVRQRGTDVGVARDLLTEASHGPHEMAWWFNGIQLKLGLLGKVIGFSILALELGQMQNFDPSQSTQLLKSLTGGLGIALLTTMTGLAGNILLGLQLMRLDRHADALVADILALGEHQRGG